MTLTEFKLAVLSHDEFSDKDIFVLFLKLKITCEDDITEAVGILKKHRPEVIEAIAKELVSPNATL